MTNQAKFTVGLEGDEGDISRIFAAFKRQLKSDAAEIESTLAKVEFFKGADAKLQGLQSLALKTRERVVELGQAIAKSLAGGGEAPAELTKALTLAEKAATAATNAYNRQATQVDKLRTSLAAAGVNTKNLAQAEEQLAAAVEKASAAATEQNAKQVLGLKTLKDVTPEINRAHAAYNTLASSGVLSSKELALAQQQLRARVAEIRAEVTGVGAAAKAGSPDVLGFFKNSILPALGLTASIGTLVAGIRSAIQTAKEFNQNIAEIGSVTNLSKGQLDELGKGARDLSRELGLNVNEALKGIFELLRSGIPADNVLTVLRASAEASKASLTDLGTGVKAANLLIETFGVGIEGLPLAFDKIVKGAKNGGITLKEFAENAGPLLAVARSAGISFDDLLATLTVLVDKSDNAGQSVADLTKIIAKLDTAEAREKLRELGIEGDSLVSIFSQIGAKGLGLDQILQLGVASAKSAAGISALTANSGELPGALEKIQTAAGSTAEAVAKLYDTPKERAERFDAAVQESERKIGDFAGSTSRLAVGVTAALNTLNKLPTTVDAVTGSFDRAEVKGTLVDNALSRAIARLFGVEPAAEAATKATDTFAVAQANLAKQAEDTQRRINAANSVLTDFSAKLLADVKSIQEASARDIADAQGRADAQIAALDRSAKASAATAATTIQVETKLAADRLAIIVKAEADVNSAVDKAVAARAVLARKSGDDEKKVAADAAAARIAALAPVLAQYQAHYNALITQAQGFAAKQQEIDAERISFNRDIEQQLFAIRLTGLSVFDQYVEKSAEADRLISEARKAGAEGDVKSAKQFTDQAIGLANQLGEVTDQNGIKVVTALQAQTDKVNLVKRAAAGYNEILGEQAKAAKDGADATKAGIDAVVPKLKDLQDRYDTLKKTIDAGLTVKIATDESSVSKALATIDDLTRPREVVVTVKTVNADGTPAPSADVPIGPSGQPLARGGLVGARRVSSAPPAPVRFFAGGGSVFSRPTWSKVPGTGNRDTVPALLQAGQFVLRKAAGQLYGDTLMGRVVRGYAGGGSVFGMNDRSNGTSGTVTRDEIKKYAENKWGFDPFSNAPIAANGFAPFNTAARVFDPGNIGSSPGRTGTTAPETDPSKGFRSGDSFQDKFEQRVISLDTRPIPEALITAANVIEYAKQMLNSVGQNNPLLGTLGQAILSGIVAVSRNPNDKSALTSLLQAAETIGANPYLFEMWGKTAGSPGSAQIQPEWFIDFLTDRGLVDSSGAATGGAGGAPSSLTGVSGATGQPGRLLAQNPLGRAFRGFGNDAADRILHPAGNLLPSAANNFAKQFFQQAIPAAGDPPFVLARIAELRKRIAQPFAAGGGSTDTVPAMLTPGEHVVQRPRVAALTRWFGPGFMDAINSLRVSPQTLRAMMAAPAPMMARFAAGGSVGSVGSSVGPLPSAVAGSSTTNVYLQASAADLFSIDNIRRYLIPALDNVKRRSNK